MNRRPNVGRHPGWEAIADKLVKRRPAVAITVIMRACTTRQKAESIVQCGQRTKRIRHRALKPANHPRADAAEDRAIPPRLAKRPIDAMDAPHRKQIRRVSAADVNQILRQQMLGGIAIVAAKESKTRRPAAKFGEGEMKPPDIVTAIAAGGGQEANPGICVAGQPQYIKVQPRIARFHAETAAAHDDDLAFWRGPPHPLTHGAACPHLPA